MDSYPYKTVFPEEKWQKASPASQGIDTDRLNAAMAYLAGSCGKHGTDQAVIIRNGYMIWNGSDINNRHEVWSCTKSFVSTLLGLLLEAGKCTLETPAYLYAPFLIEKYSEVTLCHFATMTSGYNGVGRTYDEDGSKNPFLPNTPMFSPGQKYMYWDDAMNSFGYVLTRIAREPLHELFKRCIADPIGMTDWHWRDFGMVDGYLVNGASGNLELGIYITASEMARFGLLYLNRGNWNGRQLISSDWIDQATVNQVPVFIPHLDYPGRPLDGRGVYGFNWWVNGFLANGRRKWPDAPKGAYSAIGFRNNRCIVIPEWNMVIVRLGTDDVAVNDSVYNEFLRQIGQSIKDC